MIADCFGISLVKLLNGSSDYTKETVPQVKKTDGNDISDYILSGAIYSQENDACISEVTLVAPDNTTVMFSFSEHDGSPRFFRSSHSLFNKLMSYCVDQELPMELDQDCFLSGEDYVDIFSRIDTMWLPICRYLIFISTEDEETARDLIEQSEGKPISEINIPIPSREPEDLFCVNYSDLSVVYRFRLMVPIRKYSKQIHCQCRRALILIII